MAENPSPMKGKPVGAAPSPPEKQEQVVHHKSNRMKRRPEQGAMQLNMTSMIDVVFLLLIYFVITATFIEGEGLIEANFPAGSGDTQADVPELNRKIRVTVASHGEYGTGYLLDVDVSSAAPVDFQDLHQMLAGLRESFGADNPVIIAPRADVRWQHVVNAFNAAVAAEFENIAFEQASGDGG